MTALGIDTSNYTTSAAVYDGINHVMSRKILDVKQGARGIRQSEGVFIHNRELPNIIARVLSSTDGKIDAVGVSTRPRNVDGSYMPVFTVGHSHAKTTAVVADIPLYEFSHQDGHIMAGLYSAGRFDFLDKPFIAVHLSGGTTEILRAEYDGSGFICDIVGGTLDISAGQLIDRVGVAMGLKFPCGAELEKLARTGKSIRALPVSVKGSYMNFSGTETKLTGEMAKYTPGDTALSLMHNISDVLIKTVSAALKSTGLSRVLLVGGVASNGIIKERIGCALDADTVFASRELSSDNAVGIAVLAYRKVN